MPSLFVVTDEIVPFIVTVAPGNGFADCPSVTFPFSSFCCAVEVIKKATSNKREIIFLINTV